MNAMNSKRQVHRIYVPEPIIRAIGRLTRMHTQGHYDGVIRNYRETVVTSWGNQAGRPDEKLLEIVHKIKALLPSSNGSDIQMHALHLSASGEILSHVDNVNASGPHILGVSLGAARIMRMERKGRTSTEGFDVLLPSGTVYVQRFVEPPVPSASANVRRG